MAKADIQEQYGLFINGEFVPASDGATFDAHNPANGEHLAYFAEATKEDVDKAVKAARVALPAWSKTSPIERQNILLKIADIIDANADHLALVETLDNGKPIRETKAADIPLGSDHFRYFAGCLRAWEGSATMLDDNTLSLILHEPVGVVGQVIPGTSPSPWHAGNWLPPWQQEIPSSLNRPPIHPCPSWNSPASSRTSSRRAC